MADLLFEDAIEVFEASDAGRGAAHIGGDDKHQSRYRALAFDMLACLRQHNDAGEIRFSPFADPDMWGRAAGGNGAGIEVNEAMRPEGGDYGDPENQAKVAGMALALVHQAGEVVRHADSFEDELLCRNIAGHLIADLTGGVAYTSKVSGHLQIASLSGGTSLAIEVLRRVTHEQAELTRSGRTIDVLVAHPECRRLLKGEFVRRALGWWGGPEQRTPETLGHYLNALAAQPGGDAHANVDAVMEILGAFRSPALWQQAERVLTAGALPFVRGAVSGARLTGEAANRMSRIEQFLHEDFGQG